ncbi:DNA methyltransferase [Streptococcus thermophilus]|jgi:adenine-specific DNA-methyltransferase|uniref:DNA methyltransferase n=1 Tax=Streptococcus thermophilus TaxID=1308 RepID=UPI0003EFE238|nr:DNA methyltransferase [Streptococcus thermophilus]EWM61832.1 type III restriction-modification system methylation subunit [Streptococcus thermophilus TH1477]MBO1166461.1 site-specific DNA-methyltransferase [Streptococcus thermophilus]PJH79351.1 site-specific DNA-methyltransferase [Streptococcus thermophilus]
MAKIEPKIFDELKTALVSFGDKYFVGEELNRSKLTDDLRNYDEALLSKLFEVDFIKQHFIKEVAGQKLFQIEQLEEAVLYNDYWDTSYTKYENRVGLASKGKFLQDSQDVVLDFPFKDGVLTASMTKEDNEDGYDDAFLNEVIEKDEIDRLFDKKVFVNVKRFGDNQTAQHSTAQHSTAQHSTAVDNGIVSFDKEKDNLIIKGNNLLALHTLREKYTGQIKLIYIDPPYNTGSDSFLYNDRFNHSAWLTFMKNRLEIARELLTDDGYIFIQTDDSEQAYLKVLMDSIFGRNQYVNTISVLFKNIAGASGGGQDKRLKKNIEYVTIYSKNRELSRPFNSVYEFKKISNLVQEMREEGVSWKYTSILVDSGTEKYVGSTIDGAGNEIKLYKQENPVIKSISSLMKEESLTEEQAYDKYGKFAFQTAMPQSSIRPRVMEKWQELGLGENDLMSIRYVPRTGKNKGVEYQQFYKGNTFRLFAWLKDVSEEIDGTLYKRDALGTFWNFVGETKNVNKEGQVEFPNGKKPERLLGKIIEMATEPNDLVLDFFGGSGSTAAATLKLGRNFISIEQMESQVSLEIERLKNVIDGSDQNGLSSDVNWQGGGSFVYAELFPKNMGYLQDVIHAKNLDELKSVYERMLSGTDTDEPADISFRADLSKIDWMEGFDENKRLLVKLLDKNGLYYNYSEIDDKNVRDLISDEDYTFNKNFYEGGD